MSLFINETLKCSGKVLLELGLDPILNHMFNISFQIWLNVITLPLYTAPLS